jgi:hypothetical protein
MKFNLITTIIAITACLLIAYGFYALFEGEQKLLLSGGSFLFLALTLVTAIGIKFEQQRTTTNIRVVSAIFFIVALISNLIFSFCQFSTPVYVLTNGILLLVFIFTVYSIGQTKV